MAKKMNMVSLQFSLKLIDKKAEMSNELAKSSGILDPNIAKLNGLLADEEFCTKLIESESPAKAAAFLAENGVALSEASVNELGKYIASVSKYLIDNGGELSETDLENVAGGVLSEATIAVSVAPSLFSSSVGAGATAGTAGCPVVGTIIGAVVAAAIAGGIIYRKEIAAGAKKLGGWIKSWF